MARLSLFLLVFLSSVSFADDLYRITLSNYEQAAQLNSMGLHPLVDIGVGYLLLADDGLISQIQALGIEPSLVRAGVEKDALVLDTRHDSKNVEKFELIYEQDGFRVLLMSPFEKSLAESTTGIMPIVNENLIFQYFDPDIEIQRQPSLGIDLNALIGLIEQDSIISYLNVLQAFNGRVAGSPSMWNAREWVESKFQEFGYTEIYTETFPFSNLIGGNVFAIKPGSKYPEYQIIVGAHLDAAQGSPGADDNGSGSAAVLEVARVLKNVETNLTFVFVLFGAEEVGLRGSSHYADEAIARGDKIEYMFNYDMVGGKGNLKEVDLHYGSNNSFAYMCQGLADSLLFMDAYMAGPSSRSDHYSFAEHGIQVTFAIEYNFSDVYHTPQDSTSYINFMYLTKVAKMGLASVSAIDDYICPKPALLAAFDDGLPSAIPANQAAALSFRITGTSEGIPVSGTAAWNYSTDGENYSTLPLTELSDNYYEVNIPATPPGALMYFYISSDETVTGEHLDCFSGSPHRVYFLNYDGVVFEDDFEIDNGWTVEGSADSGHWEMGIPSGDGSFGDPPVDFDGSGSCFVTGNSPAEEDVDFGRTSLISPVLDLSDGICEIRYAIWYNNRLNYRDDMKVYISGNNGSNWTIVEVLGPFLYSDGGWQTRSFIANDYIGSSSEVLLKFNASEKYVLRDIEAGIDAFKVSRYYSDPIVIPEQQLPEWTIHQPYSAQLVAEGGVGEYIWEDESDILVQHNLTLHPNGSITGASNYNGLFSFIATAFDNYGNYTQKTVTIQFNELVNVETYELPDAEVNVDYSYLMSAGGGTGLLIWSDRNDDLNGTGFSLNSDGLLSGLSGTEEVIKFTAYIEDIAGSYAEWDYEFAVKYDYVDGDANGDGKINIGDVVFIINYIFKQGEAPYPLKAGDANCDESVNIGDAIFLVNHIFKGWPAPGC